VRLVYVRAPGANTCPEESFVHKAVAAQYFGHDPFTSDAPKKILLTVGPIRGGFVAVATLHDAYGTLLDSRDHKALRCTEALDYMSVSIAGWVFPIPPGRRVADLGEVPRGVGAAGSEAPASEEVPKSPRPPPAPPPAFPPAPAELPPKPLPTLRPRLVGEMGAVASFGTLPGPTGGFAGAVGVRWPLISLSLEVLADVPESTDPQLAGGRRTNISLVYGSLVPCVHSRWIVGCGLLSSGMISAVQVLPSWSTSFYGSAGVRLGFEYPSFANFTVRATGDVVIPFVRDHEVTGAATVWTTPPVGLALGTRLVATF
jgi:hypothetical protein